MNSTKKINVNFSSLVGLKAELLRKQNEVSEIKLKSEINHLPSKIKERSKKAEKKKPMKDLKNVDVKHIEDIDTHKKSKLMLEAKAKLYNRLKKSKNNNDNFLVDFTNKSDDSEEELFSKDNEEENNITLTNEDDWVEYEDCFGRTRKCLQEDLPLMKKKDELMKQQIISKKGIDPKTKDNVEQDVTEEKKETEIEIMRRKWEEQTKKLMDKVNIHYQDILFDEARTHGVGYYAFSQDEKERIKQQENLVNLRKDTEQRQKEIKKLKDLKEKMEGNRLKAARIRQRIRAGLPVESVKEELQQNDATELNSNTLQQILIAREESVEVTEEDNSNKQDEKENSVLEKENKINALGELLGKRSYWYEMSQEEWVEKCRKIRVNEFGPVYNNYENASNVELKGSDSSFTAQNEIKCNGIEMNLENDVQSNSNEINANSDTAFIPPILIRNSFNEKHSRETEQDRQISSKTTYSIQHESNSMDAVVNNMTIAEVKPNRNIDEASIEAGLRYLRKKFEENQST